MPMMSHSPLRKPLTKSNRHGQYAILTVSPVKVGSQGHREPCHLHANGVASVEGWNWSTGWYLTSIIGFIFGAFRAAHILMVEHGSSLARSRC